MSALTGRHVVLGVSGSIACYRACDVVRELRGLGATVRVAPTTSAQAFVTAKTFESLSGAPVLTTALDVEQGRIPHVEEAYRASVIVVAPASANTIAKMAAGFADEAILSLLLSFQGPVVVAPAMETNMWNHPATQANVAILKERGVIVVGPVAGPLASGREGYGRLSTVADIVEHTIQAATPQTLAGRRFVVTAGPTVEDIDPVRSLTNRSSGKMGFAVAQSLARRGADVALVHGPTKVTAPTTKGITAHPVRSAAQMAAMTLGLVDDIERPVDGCVLAAAVADFTPTHVETSKLKKKDGAPQIELEKTVDILATLGAKKPRVGVLVGFAAETQDVEAAAEEKRQRKGCDLVIGNDVSGTTTGFDVDFNRLYLAWNATIAAPRWTEVMPKSEAADVIAQAIETLLAKRTR